MLFNNICNCTEFNHNLHFYQTLSQIQSWNDLQSREMVTTDQVVDFYDSWAATYDQSVKESASANIALSAVLSMFPAQEKRGEIEVLDIAAGTGRVGQKLFENGFRKIDALEPSSEMLNILGGRNIYRNIYQTKLGGGHKAISILDDSYDLIVISGGFAKSHLPVDCLEEVVRMGKNGSLFINRMTAKYLETVEEYTNLEPFMKELETRGCWSQVCRRLDNNKTFLSGPSVTHVYRITKTLTKEI